MIIKIIGTKTAKKNTETARLNAGQFEAAHFLNGPALVLAGPGSGKTKVITERVKFLTEEAGVLPEKILVLTFSKAAAEEMKKRYLEISAPAFRKVTFGTFHSVFYSILCTLPQYRNLKIAEQGDRQKAIHTAMLRRFGKNRYTSDLLNLVLDDIGRVKNGLSPKITETKELYGEYNEELKANGMLDYDDMLLDLYREIRSNKLLLRELRDRYSYLLIDEFQDINRVQYETVKLLAYPGNNLFCVGDDDQSIYAFRGSDPGFMRKMPEELPETKLMELKINYRSTKQIVSVTKKLIRHNLVRYPKEPEAFRGAGPDPVIAKFASPKEEAAYITEKAAALPEGKTAAVLGRTNRAVNDLMELIPENVRDRISFHSFHTSKGLEYDCVFVAACNEEVTPGQRVNGKEEMEEERRAFYVAATRARTQLFFLYTEVYKDKVTPPSSFLRELIGK